MFALFECIRWYVLKTVKYLILDIFKFILIGISFVVFSILKLIFNKICI